MSEDTYERLNPGDTQKLVSEQAASEVYRDTEQIARKLGVSVSELPDSQRPGFDIEVLKGTVAVGSNRSSITREKRYKSGDYFRVFPLGREVWAFNPSQQLTYSAEPEEAVLQVQRSTLATDHVITAERQPIQHGGTLETLGNGVTMYPNTYHERLVYMACFLDDDLTDDDLESRVAFYTFPDNLAPDVYGDGHPAREETAIINRGPEENPDMSINTADTQHIFVDMALPSVHKLLLDFNAPGLGAGIEVEFMARLI